MLAALRAAVPPSGGQVSVVRAPKAPELRYGLFAPLPIPVEETSPVEHGLTTAPEPSPDPAADRWPPAPGRAEGRVEGEPDAARTAGPHRPFTRDRYHRKLEAALSERDLVVAALLRRAQREESLRIQVEAQLQSVLAQQRERSAAVAADLRQLAESREDPALSAGAGRFDRLPIPTRDQPTAREGAGWITAALRRLAADDLELAGLMLLHLLPLQGDADPTFIPLSVRVPGGRTFATGRGPGPTEHLDLPATTAGQIVANRMTLLATPLASGGSRLRRRQRAQLQALADHPMTLAGVHAAGIAPGPELLLPLVAHGIDPRWTLRNHGAVVVRSASDPDPVVLTYEDGETRYGTEMPPAGVPVATVQCPPDRTLAVLLGDADGLHDGCSVTGDRRSLMVLQSWIGRLDGAIPVKPSPLGTAATR